MTNALGSAEAQSIAKRLRARGETIAVAESSTGGLIAADLLSIPGASAYFKGGTVIYTAESRKILLGVRKVDVAEHEPLTVGMASHFAQVVRHQLNADWGIAELGAAGPTGTRYGHDAGVSVIAISGPADTAIQIDTGLSDRGANMWAFTLAGLAELDRLLASLD